MESIPYNPLIQVTQEDMEEIRKSYDLDKVQINENLDVIEDWAKKQEHLREALNYLIKNSACLKSGQVKKKNRQYRKAFCTCRLTKFEQDARDNIERLHILARGSVEATKLKLDKILTTRGLLPEIVLNKSIDEFKEITNDILFVILPKLSPKCRSRIFVTQIKNDNIQNFNFTSYVRYCALVLEFKLHYEYSRSDRYILDFKNMNMNILTALKPTLIKKCEALCMEAYGAHVKGIHILNAPSFIDKIVYLLKQCLKAKLAQRIYVHTCYEELQKEIPKDIIPEEYGGDGPSCMKIAEQWKDYLKTDAARQIVDISNKLYSDESKRTCSKFNEEYLGMPGSFRRLNVD